jgi:phage tail tape-measure protein
MSDLNDSYKEMKKADRDLEMAEKKSELEAAFSELPDTAKGVAMGAAIGSFGGPPGAIIGGLIGGAIGFFKK